MFDLVTPSLIAARDLVQVRSSVSVTWTTGLKNVVEKLRSQVSSATRGTFLTSLVHAHGEQLARFFATRVADRSDAQDLVQEVYLRILKLERPDLIRHPRAYVYTIAASVVYEHRQKRWSRPLHVALEDLPADALPVDEDPVAMVERVDQLTALLNDLPTRVRAALIWAHRDGHTYAEISALLSVPRNRVKKYLAKALAHCRGGVALGAVTG